MKGYVVMTLHLLRYLLEDQFDVYGTKEVIDAVVELMNHDDETIVKRAAMVAGDFVEYVDAHDAEREGMKSLKQYIAQQSVSITAFPDKKDDKFVVTDFMRKAGISRQEDLTADTFGRFIHLSEAFYETYEIVTSLCMFEQFATDAICTQENLRKYYSCRK